MIYPILLSGGAGTRLWPLSRRSYPKQFVELFDEVSLFQETAKRLCPSNVIEFAPHVVVTNSDFRFIVLEQLQNAGIDPGTILIEPKAKNTAAAIAAASIFIHAADPEAVLLVSPCDHKLVNVREFHRAIEAGMKSLDSGSIVTFGITPSYAATEFGYLELAINNFAPLQPVQVLKFTEKPRKFVAAKMVANKKFLWNAGIFLFKAKDMLEAFKLHEPEMLELVNDAVEMSSPDLNFVRLAKQPWAKVKEISVDHAIMEKANKIVAVPISSEWSDLGSWDSVWAHSKPDINGNVISKSAHGIECSNTLLRSESGEQQLVGVGLDNIIAIAMKDAVLVAPKDRAQDVKKAVALLNAKEVPQGEVYPKEYRPWGWFESLVLAQNFQVKRIYVKANSALSLQSHKLRSEHWVVVAGMATVTLGAKLLNLSSGQSIYIPAGSKHRLSNCNDEPLEVIEVQIGTYFGEDDIIRYEDEYNRP